MAEFKDYSKKVTGEVGRSTSTRSVKSSKSGKGKEAGRRRNEDGDMEEQEERPRLNGRRSSSSAAAGSGEGEESRGKKARGLGTSGGGEKKPILIQRKSGGRNGANHDEERTTLPSVVRESDPIIDYGAIIASRKAKGLSSLASMDSDPKMDKVERDMRKTKLSNGNGKSRQEPEEEEEEEESPVIPPPVVSPKSAMRRSSSRRKVVEEEDSSEIAGPENEGPKERKKSMNATKSSSQLSPQDRHYLNKALVYLQMQREWSLLSGIGTLASYGPPFLPHPNGPNSRPLHLNKGKAGIFGGVLGGGKVKRQEGWDDYEWKPEGGESEVLGYMFWRFIYNFPALRLAKPVYWTDQIQPLFDSFAERDLSTTRERSEVTKRRLLSMGLTRILGTYYGTCMRSLQPSAPARPSLKIMRRVDFLYPGAMAAMWKTQFPRDPIGYNAYAAIVGIEGAEDFLVFSQVIVVEAKPMFLVLRSWSKFRKLSSSLKATDPENRLDLPLLPPSLADGSPPEATQLQTYLRWLIIALSTPHDSEIDSSELKDARGKLEQFLLDKPLKESKSEMERYSRDAKKADEKLEVKRAAWVKIGERAKELRTTWVLYKTALIQGDEIDKSMALVRRTPLISSLPVSHRDAQYFAAVWVSYALHYLFVASPNAAELTHLLKSFHDLVPYGALKLGLTLVNPTLAIRAVVAIVLGQPGGAPSLFQRIFSIVLGGGIKTQKKTIAALQVKLGNETLCRAIESHVYAPFTQRAGTRAAAEQAEEDIVLTIIRDYASSSDFKLVKEWHKDFIRRAMTGKATEVHQEDESAAGRYQCLKNLLRAHCLKRDREQVMELVMERNTPQMMHESIAVFYDSIYKIANAANLAARLGDLQAFLGDLIEVAMSDNKNPADFIKLARRHDQNLYFFVHELASNGGDLMDPIIEWSKSGLNFIRDGIPPAEDARRNGESLRKRSDPKPKRAGVDYDALLNDAPKGVRAAVVQEVRGLALYSTYKKAWADICLRGDLLEVETGESIDKAALYSDLLSQDEQVLLYLDERDDYNPDENIEWAWYAEEDALNDPSSIKLDWAAAERAEKALADSRKKTRGSLFRKSSSTSQRSSQAASMEDASLVARVTVPPPRINATRSLLQAYCEVNRPSLVGARKAEIK